jgi:hypothetical protein
MKNNSKRAVVICRKIYVVLFETTQRKGDVVFTTKEVLPVGTGAGKV